MGEIFVSKVSELRKAQGLTQQQLAVKLGVSLSTVRNWETGRQAVDTFVKIDKLCETLKVGPSDLYDSIDPMEGEAIDE
jgi:transcriptional regulator with XRE-family HTH domain